MAGPDGEDVVAPAARSLWPSLALGVLTGVLTAGAVMGVIVLPLFFFAAVTEPVEGTDRPLFRTGEAVAPWVAAAVGTVATVAMTRWHRHAAPFPPRDGP